MGRGRTNTRATVLVGSRADSAAQPRGFKSATPIDMIGIVLLVMERVPTGRETREKRLFFPVGTDRPALRRPAALDHPSPVPGIGPAGLNPAFLGARYIDRECPSPSAYLSCDLRSLCACRLPPGRERTIYACNSTQAGRKPGRFRAAQPMIIISTVGPGIMVS
jgi:hypothetical protein